MSWARGARIYGWAMTQHQKKLIRHHFTELFGPECEEKYGKFDVDRLMKATSLIEMDEVYSRRRAGYSSLEEYYRSASCKHYIENVSTCICIDFNSEVSFVTLFDALDISFIEFPLIMAKLAPPPPPKISIG